MKVHVFQRRNERKMDRIGRWIESFPESFIEFSLYCGHVIFPVEFCEMLLEFFSTFSFLSKSLNG